MEEGGRFDRLQRLIKKIGGDEPEVEQLLPHERRAYDFAVALRKVLDNEFPVSEDPYYPIKWAVRTSMDDIANAPFLDEIMQELSEEQLNTIGRKTGQTGEQIKDRFKDQGDELDKASPSRSHVTVECSIDHNHIDDPENKAAKFLKILNEVVENSRPDDSMGIRDEFTPLSKGVRPETASAGYDNMYFFHKG